jgi:glycosyltransferase involved in cell wall biosynthesis
MDKQQQRILLIIPNLDFGGAQNSFSRLSLLLKPYCSLLLVVFNKDNIAPLEFGGDLVELEVSGSETIVGKIINFFKRVNRLRRIKKEFTPHASISFLEGADYINLLSSVGEEIFFYVHGSKQFDRNIEGVMGSLRKKILIPLFYRRANKILVVNSRIAEELKVHFGLSKSVFEVLPNFYDVEQIQRKANEDLDTSLARFFNENIVLSISGRLAVEKGIDRFVQIMPDLLRNHNKLKLAFIGDGPQKEIVMNLLRQVEMPYQELTSDSWVIAEETIVLFLGYQSNPYKFMGRSYMLVLPSLNEGMPNTLVEAMALGVPVVASDCNYGPREILSEQKMSSAWPDYSSYGILVPAWTDPEAGNSWILAINRLIEDSVLRDEYVAAGRMRATEFSTNRATSSWRKLLNV